MTRLLVGVLAAALAVLVGAVATTASPPSTRTVPCEEGIDEVPFPYLGRPGLQYRYRLVLGAISAPPAYLERVVATHERPWAYWSKAALVIRAGGRAVSVSVPKAWRDRAAIIWGNGNHDPFSSLRIARGCGSDLSVGNVYAGGFFLRSTSACVPVVFRVGTRSAIVRFGVGRRCR